MWSYQHWDSSNFSNLYDDELVHNDEESIHVCTPPPASISNSSYTHIHPPRINLSMVRIPRKFRTHHHVLNWIGLKHVGVPPTYLLLLTRCLQELDTRQALQPAICLPEVATSTISSTCQKSMKHSLGIILRIKLLQWNFMNVCRTGI